MADEFPKRQRRLEMRLPKAETVLSVVEQYFAAVLFAGLSSVVTVLFVAFIARVFTAEWGWPKRIAGDVAAAVRVGSESWHVLVIGLLPLFYRSIRDLVERTEKVGPVQVRASDRQQNPTATEPRSAGPTTDHKA
ncbi:MAG: hypothetical protein HY719_08430 [Planctomycetes bacterium]|nr:hypothetical protein [Planctomycetota bacterium]